MGAQNTSLLRLRCLSGQRGIFAGQERKRRKTRDPVHVTVVRLPYTCESHTATTATPSNPPRARLPRFLTYLLPPGK